MTSFNVMEQLYLAMGKSLFPIQPNAKNPMTKHGYQNATVNLKIYAELHRNRPHNLAWPTGEGNGMWVLDVDAHHGGNATMREWVNQWGEFPKTWVVKTPHQGLHFYFLWESDRPVANRVAIARGIDVRGEGGYVVIPPSVVEGKPYIWLTDPRNTPLAKAPDWLYERMHTSSDALQPFQICESVSEGHRNVTMTRLVGSLIGHGISATLLWTLVSSVNMTHITPPLSESELLKIVTSILNREIKKRTVRQER